MWQLFDRRKHQRCGWTAISSRLGRHNVGLGLSHFDSLSQIALQWGANPREVGADPRVGGQLDYPSAEPVMAGGRGGI